MAESARICANVGSERKEQLKKIADKRFNGSLTAALNFAIDRMTADEARERASIPLHIKEAINYMRLIMHTGTPERDWSIIKQEVDNLWKNLQS